jgi:hypothetical protein
VISPDLTKDDPRYQGPGGGPITNEGAGGEVYGTIFSIAPSSVDAQVIWTGSDDGLVHVTRDGGETWTDVTPPGLPDELSVNAVEASPHAPGTAYAAYTAYKFNDFTPYAYRTVDYGESWEAIVSGIPQDHWVRVVREDTDRPGLLYAGTELGAFVSFDDGEQWQPLQNNLPVTPVTDLKVHQGDLVAATQGRAFWILDDLSPLRALAREPDRAESGEPWLLEPRDPYRQEGGGGGGDTAAGNPPPGATLYFHLPGPPEGEVTLEFRDAQGTVVRSYSTEPGGGAGAPSRLTAAEGMNRVSWNLRRENVAGVDDLFVFGSLAGARVPPGEYVARLTTPTGPPQEVSFQVRDIPPLAAEVTAEDHRAREALLQQIRTELEGLHGAVNTLTGVRAQVEDARERTEDHPRADTIRIVAAMVDDSVNAIDSMLVQRQWTTGQDPTVFTTRLNQFFIYLHQAVADTPGRPTKGMTDQFERLSEEWGSYEEEIERVLGPVVDRFNQLLRELGVEAVVIPRRLIS